MQSREDFYEKTINIERADKMLTTLIKECNLSEILWIIRSIAYDQVAYYSDDNKGIIYRNPDKYSRLTIDQANNLQRQLSTICDLFGQAICQGREFNPEYLKQYEFAGPYLITLDSLKDKYNKLKEQITNINVD